MGVSEPEDRGPGGRSTTPAPPARAVGPPVVDGSRVPDAVDAPPGSSDARSPGPSDPSRDDAVLDPLLALTLALLLLIGGVLAASGREGREWLPGHVDGDVTAHCHPVQTFLRRTLASGEWPLWNPHAYLGYPIYAASTSRLTYPPWWLFNPRLPLGLALHLEALFHLIVIGVLTAHLARVLGLARPGAWVAGLGVSLSPLLAMRLATGHLTVLAAIAWLPGILASLIRLSRGHSGAIVPGALFIGLSAHAGHVQELYYALAIGLPVALGLALLRPGARLRCTGLVVLAVLLGLGLGAVQLLALAELAADGDRGRGDWRWAAQQSTLPEELLCLLVPDLFGDDQRVPGWGPFTPWETRPAFGLVLVLLASCAPLVAPGRTVNALVAGSMTIGLLTMGRTLAFQEVFVRLVPGFGVFRAHAKMNLVLLVLLGCLAGATAEALGRRGFPAAGLDRALRGVSGVAVLLAGLAVLGMGMGPSSFSWLPAALHDPRFALDRGPPADPHVLAVIGDHVTNGVTRGALLAIGLLALVAYSRRRRDGWPAATAVALLVAIEFATCSRAFLATSEAPSVPPAVRDWLEQRPAGTRVDFTSADWRRERHFLQRPMLWDMEAPSGYTALVPRWTLALINVSQHRAPDSLKGAPIPVRRYDGLARLFGVSRVVAPAGTVLPGVRRVATVAGLDLFLCDGPWPRAWVTRQVHVARSAREALAWLVDPAFDLATRAVVELADPMDGTAGSGVPDWLMAPPWSGQVPGPGTAAVAPRTSDAITILARGANWLELEAVLETRGLVVIAESYDRGWSAWRVSAVAGGGTALRVLRVDHGLRGLVLEAGRHRVRMEYRPRTSRVGIRVSLLALAIVAGLAILQGALSMRRVARAAAPGSGRR
jgi:hypothetical protein